MERVGPARAPALPGWDPRNPIGSSGLTCLVSTVDGSRRKPGVRRCAQRHGPRASLPALTSKASLQHFPETDRSSLACSSRSGSSDGLSRTPKVRQCAQRHGPRASLPASKASLQHFPETDRSSLACSSRSGSSDGHQKFASAEHPRERRRPRRQGFATYIRVRPPALEPRLAGATGSSSPSGVLGRRGRRRSQVGVRRAPSASRAALQHFPGLTGRGGVFQSIRFG